MASRSNSVEAWLESNPGKAKSHAAPEKAKAPDAEAEKNGSPYDIEWTEDTFKNNSFWHYDDGEYEFVFQIDGGSPLPKATSKCVKIKRDEMMAMKKTIDLITVEDIMNADPVDVEEPGDYEEDDDGMDLL